MPAALFPLQWMDCWQDWRNTDKPVTAAASQRLFYIYANPLQQRFAS